jgi:hypothetical protein
MWGHNERFISGIRLKRRTLFFTKYQQQEILPITEIREFSIFIRVQGDGKRARGGM